VLDRFKQFWQGVMLAPFINLFIRLGISPDVVTLVGTLGVSFGALFKKIFAGPANAKKYKKYHLLK
jgi:hypothetical protein